MIRSIVANELRPVLLRLARLVRRESHALGVTVGQVTLLVDDRATGPGSRAASSPTRERISAPGMSAHLDRLEAAGLIVRTRGADRRRVGLTLSPEGRRVLRAVRAAANRLARRAARSCSATRSAPRSRPRSSRSRGCSRRRHDAARPQRRPAHVREPAPPSQLPALLRRPDHLGLRDVDAERRALLADPQPDPLADRGRDPLARALRALHPARAVRRRRRRPLRQPADGDRHPVGADGVLGACSPRSPCSGRCRPGRSTRSPR